MRQLARAVLLLSVILLAGCATSSRRPEAVTPATSAEFREAMKNARGEGRSEVDDLLAIYGQVPAEMSPGLAALRLAIIDARTQAKIDGRDRLNAEEVDRLTLRNPDFWAAWFEFRPGDVSLQMLHASLLMEAGELFRASLVLTAGVQAAPISVRERMFWLAQQARTHWTIFRRLDDLRTQERSWVGSSRQGEAALAAALAEWPQDGYAAEALLRRHAGLSPRAADDDETQPVVLPAAVRARVSAELARLRRCSPVAAARYAEGPAAAAFGRLWEEFTDEDQPVEERTLQQLAARAQELGFPEMALVFGRLQAARRGFYVPADFGAARQALGQWLPEPALTALMTPFEEGLAGRLQLTKPPEPPEEVLPGMDPLVHPLLAEHAVREHIRETLWLEAVKSQPVAVAAHLRERGIRSSNVGRFTAALSDLDAAVKLQPHVAGLLIDRAVVLAKLGREDDSEAAFAAARLLNPKDDYLRSSLAIRRLAQGRFVEAEALFLEASPKAENYEYSVIFGYLCSLRREVPDRAWLQAHRMKGTKWPVPIQRYLLGEIDRRALLAAAQDPSDLRTSEQQCEAFLSLGEAALAAGDRETARADFENGLQTGIVGFIEYDLAKHELARLVSPETPAPAAKPAPPPVEQAAGSGDGGTVCTPLRSDSGIRS